MISVKPMKNLYIKERQIWWVHTGVNIWSETYGKWNEFKRPFLVIKKAWNMFVWCYTTTKWKPESNFYIQIQEQYLGNISYIVKSQIKSIDKRRFLEKMCTIWIDDFNKIKNNLKTYIFWD